MINELIIPTVERTPLHIQIKDIPMNEQFITQWHFHDEYELLLSTKGKFSVFIAEREFTLNAGDILFINRKVPHETIAYAGEHVVALQFKNPFDKDEDLDKFLLFLTLRNTNDFLLVRKGDEHHRTFSDSIANIVTEAEQKQPAYVEFIRGYLQQLFAYLYRHNIIAHHAQQLNQAELQHILPALKYINSHYHEPISLENISKLLLVDKSHFCRIFKKYTSTTFVDYLNTVRIYHAENLLIKTDLTITSIALRVGFSSAAYFIKAFKRYNACTPSKYRKVLHSKA